MLRLADLQEFEFTEKVVKKDRKNKKKKMLQLSFDWLTSGQEKELEAIQLLLNEERKEHEKTKQKLKKLTKSTKSSD